MRRIIVGALAAAAAWAATAAGAQVAPQPVPAPRSADEFVCALTGVCDQEDEPVATIEGPLTRSGPPQSGVRLVRRSLQRTAPQQTAARADIVAQPGSSSTARSTRRTAPTGPAAAPRSRPRAQVAPTDRVDLSLAFELGSATLTEQARTQAAQFAEALLRPALESASFRIEGHTDNIGGRSYNLDLSRRRAEAVAEYLSSLHVPRERLVIAGYGYDRPVPGKTAAAVENRRVEAVRVVPRIEEARLTGQ